MTNKNEMPVVGKIYTPKLKSKFTVVSARKNCLIEMKDDEGNKILITQQLFCSLFEPIAINSVEEALRDLKECVNNKSITKYRTVFEKAQNLINALEANGNKQVETFN